jgi:hypothetical protein
MSNNCNVDDMLTKVVQSFKEEEEDKDKEEEEEDYVKMMTL